MRSKGLSSSCYFPSFNRGQKQDTGQFSGADKYRHQSFHFTSLVDGMPHEGKTEIIHKHFKQQW